MDTILSNNPYKILLLTNRDSDNVGDQVIEACDIALIKTVMKNLGIKDGEFKISSRAAGIISKKYLSTRAAEDLKSAENAIRNCDIIIFGGAPLFNYLYQMFYERTAVTLELAQKYNKPVIFSAIGIESYHEDNEKCQRLKKTLNFECVKQITTRDGYSFLQHYKENPDLVVDKVSDPAVFAGKVFENFTAPKTSSAKKIGIFILRANGFKDNGINFSKENAAALWQGIIALLNERGYDFDLLTSGHFGDEAFLDSLIKNYGIPESKCIFNINSPEQLTQKLSSYDAIISCRLHPSIIAYAFDIPSVGIVWNSKVKGFYNSIGYEDRIIETENITPEIVVDKIEQIMTDEVHKDKEYLASVYTYLFKGIKNELCPDSALAPYNYDKLMQYIPAYTGTSTTELDLKLKRKFRRTYDKYNSVSATKGKTIADLKAENKLLKHKLKQCTNPTTKELIKMCLRKAKHILARLNIFKH